PANRCFAHIVNLAVGQLLKAFEDYIPADLPDMDVDNFIDALQHDPVTIICLLVKNIRISGLCCQALEDAIKLLNSTCDEKDKIPILTLIIGVITQCSSTYLMIEHALTLHPAIKHILRSSKNLELHRYQMNA
ncbi:hypothetical protein AAF712_016394, partial [Marasmius tenuissimus]